MSQQEYDIFQECLEGLKSGKTIQEVLRDHPDIRQELKPLLRSALQASEKRIEPLSADTIQRSRTRMLAHATELQSSAAGGTIFSTLPRFATALITLALVLIVSGYGLFSASAQALPGDFLYPVKRSAENIQLGVISDSDVKASLEEEFDQRRTDEVAHLLSEGRLQPISFEGHVEEISGQD